ncbi:hypothetical protein MTY59_15810 [Mycobacterium senriense]|uniref:Transposase n=1 Tax=Mycobacterium senriense TaxID=2775496 RepID=A0ABM7SKR0_9MYCO|nr:hypothetical protein MTY59_15810 [Mycobacterium senriense]
MANLRRQTPARRVDHKRKATSTASGSPPLAAQVGVRASGVARATRLGGAPAARKDLSSLSAAGRDRIAHLSMRNNFAVSNGTVRRGREKTRSPYHPQKALLVGLTSRV